MFSGSWFIQGYSYDLSGKRLARSTDHTSCSGCIQSYHYEPQSGLLDWTEDRGSPSGTPARFTFGYDGAGRLVNRWTNGVGSSAKVDVTIGYDAEGQLTSRSVKSGGASNLEVYGDTLAYDARGKVVASLLTSDISAITGDSWQYAYDGLGALAGTGRTRGGGSSVDINTNDALGNVVRRLSDPGTSRDRDVSFTVSGDQITQSTRAPHPIIPDGGPLDSTIFATDHFHDSNGNLIREGMVVSEATTIPPSGNGSFNQQASYGHSWLWMTYGTDNKLRYSQKSWYDVSGKRSIFTEYRYDALGRRVLTRARRDTLCTGQSEWKCLSTVDRFMWDGDQIVAEFRVPGADSLSEDALQGTFAPGDLYGRVRYTHAHGIDEPIAVWNGNVINSGIVPHASWRGQFEAGSEIQTGALLENGSPPWEWPARYRDVNLAPEIRQPIPDPTRWLGSLIEGQVELSGLAYRRNRYYNPATGRFTQEDPIGLAGGLNLYGYADGDPVNLSDPFGLSPCCAIHPGSITQSISGAIERDPLTITVNDREAMVDGLIMAATGGGGRLVGQVGSGLRAATGGLRSLFSGGTVSGRTIIGVRASLLKSGFTQGLSKNRKGYLFVNEAGEQVRIMRKAGEWEIRVRNRAGNWLDDLGNSARDRASSHDIKLINK